MFRPKLDHKYFTSDTYWTKWNYLSKWDSNSMTSKDVIEDGVLKNPSITTSYVKNQWSDTTAEELTIIFDSSEAVIDQHIGFRGNKTVKKVTVILLNYDYQTIWNLTYNNPFEEFYLYVFKSDGSIPDYINYGGYLITSSFKTKVVWCNTLLRVNGAASASIYGGSASLKNFKIIVAHSLTRATWNPEDGLIPFIQVTESINFTDQPYGASVGFTTVKREEWVRWFKEDLATLPTGTTKTLTMASLLDKLTDEDKKIATDKGWTLA